MRADAITNVSTRTTATAYAKVATPIRVATVDNFVTKGQLAAKPLGVTSHATKGFTLWVTSDVRGCLAYIFKGTAPTGAMHAEKWKTPCRMAQQPSA